MELGRLGVAADALSQYAAFGEVDIDTALTSNAALSGGEAGFLSGFATARTAAAAARLAKQTNTAKGGERLVIGRGRDLAKDNALGSGEFKLQWPPTESAKSEWKINSGLLRQEMRNMRPIRDASMGDTRGMYLNVERNLLESHGWKLGKDTELWIPPTQ